MKITRKILCELIVRDFATTYLDMHEPFSLEDVLTKTKHINYQDFNVLNNKFYTSADVRYCMRILKLNNPFSNLRAVELNEIDTKEILTHYQYDQDPEKFRDHAIKLYLYDLINSLPDTGSGLIRCKKCDKLFIPDHGNTKICNVCNDIV